MPRVSAEHKAQVRARLVDAAIDCLEERGYDGVTTREVFERAGLSAGALYHYFSSKDDLMAAAAERIFSTDMGGAFTAVAEDPAGTDSVSLISGVLARLFGGTGSQTLLPHLRVRTITDARLRDALLAYDRLLVDAMGSLNEQAKREGLLRSDVDAEALVEVVELAFESLRARQAADGFATSFPRVAETFRDVLVRGSTADADSAERVLRRVRELSR